MWEIWNSFLLLSGHDSKKLLLTTADPNLGGYTEKKLTKAVLLIVIPHKNIYLSLDIIYKKNIKQHINESLL